MEKKLVAVITPNGELVMKSSTPFVIAKNYPCHVIHKDNISLTSGDLSYWKEVNGSVPIYEGDKVEIQF